MSATGAANEIAGTATLLLDVVPHATDTERAFSGMGFQANKQRNRLDATTLCHLQRIKLFYDQQAPPKVKNSEPLQAAAAAAQLGGDIATFGGGAQLQSDDNVLEMGPAELDALLRAGEDAGEAALALAVERGEMSYMDMLMEGFDAYDLQSAAGDGLHIHAAAAAAHGAGHARCRRRRRLGRHLQLSQPLMLCLFFVALKGCVEEATRAI